MNASIPDHNNATTELQYGDRIAHTTNPNLLGFVRAVSIPGAPNLVRVKWDNSSEDVPVSKAYLVKVDRR